jgi:hypothetical protein
MIKNSDIRSELKEISQDSRKEYIESQSKKEGKGLEDMTYEQQFSLRTKERR